MCLCGQAGPYDRRRSRPSRSYPPAVCIQRLVAAAPWSGRLPSPALGPSPSVLLLPCALPRYASLRGIAVAAWFSLASLPSTMATSNGKRAHPDLNQGPADLRSAALTTELCTQLTFVADGCRRQGQHTAHGLPFFPFFGHPPRSSLLPLASLSPPLLGVVRLPHGNALAGGHCATKHTRGGTRTRNLLLRREAPYPLGHTSTYGWQRPLLGVGLRHFVTPEAAPAAFSSPVRKRPWHTMPFRPSPADISISSLCRAAGFSHMALLLGGSVCLFRPVAVLFLMLAIWSVAECLHLILGA